MSNKRSRGLRQPAQAVVVQPSVQAVPAGAKSYAWRDHPLAVAAVAVAATIVIGSTLVKDLVIPAYTATLNNQLLELPGLKQNKEDLQKKVAVLEADKIELKSQLSEAQTVSLFAPGSPYPNGLEKIKIGATREQIAAAFPSANIEKEKRDTYWSVEKVHSVFESVTYYFDAKSKTVSLILYQAHGDRFGPPFLKNKLTSSLGAPAINEDDNLVWTEKEVVVKMNSAIDRTYNVWRKK